MKGGAAARWFDSSVWTSFRGRASYDGGLTNFIPLPPTAQYGVRVCCFPSKQVTCPALFSRASE